MDPTKVKATLELESPTKVTKVRYSFGLVNYYWLLIKGYLAIATLFTNLLKKERVWTLSQGCLQPFNALKKAILRSLFYLSPTTTSLLSYRLMPLTLPLVVC